MDNSELFKEYMELPLDILDFKISYLTCDYADSITYSFMAKNPWSQRNFKMKAEEIKEKLKIAQKIFNIRLAQSQLEKDFE